MSILVVSIPPRRRLRARPLDGSPAFEAGGVAAEYSYVFSADGLQPQQNGRASASALPRADSVVAVLADGDVGWHRLILPKAPPARLSAALAGLLEEALLDEVDVTHLALAPGAAAGQPGWVAAVNRSWLRGVLVALEQAQVLVDRVVPLAWPDDPPSGHFSEIPGLVDANGTPALQLTWAHVDGVASLPLQGSLARALLPQSVPEGTRWTATPAAAAAAEQWLGDSPVGVLTPQQRELQAARSLWNLRQFDLSQKTRGTRALRALWKRWLGVEWRPARWGLGALLVIQLIGLNVGAWRQTAQLSSQRQALITTLQTSFPQVRAVLDAPAQMRREIERLRAGAGQPGEADLEPLLEAAALAWPANRPPVDHLQYEPGRLTVAAVGWAESEIEQFRSQLRPAGWDVAAAEGRLTLSRAAAR